MPFIMGIDLSMFDYALEFLNEEENIFIVNILSDEVTVSGLINSTKNNKNKTTLKADLL